MKKFTQFFIVALTIATPALVFAQGQPQTQYFTTIINFLKNSINPIAGILVGLAFIYFIWGVIKYVISSDPTKKEESKSTIIYGLIGLLVIASAWGIVRLAAQILGINNPNGNQIDTPGVNIRN